MPHSLGRRLAANLTRSALLVLLLLASGCSQLASQRNTGQQQSAALTTSAVAVQQPSQQQLSQPALQLTVDPTRARSTHNFHHIQAALNASHQLDPQANRWALIRIAPGLYREQLFIRRNKVVLAGSGLDRTVLQYPILRAEFLRQQAGTAAAPLPRGAALSADWGAAVVNIAASDIALLDLTVHNSFALENPQHPARFDHQFALRGFEKASRIITDRSVFATNGADTVSLWNKADGMYYHSRSYFSGRVDLFCPRGSALVVDSDFVNHKATATLWHDGELAENASVVVLRSNFHGVSGFQLGRRHYDGQFMLLANSYSAQLADTPIYRVTYPAEPWRNQPNRYGDRNWFYQSRGPAYSWLADRLPAQGQLAAIAPLLLQSDTPGSLVFGGRWYPEQQLAQIRQWLQSAPGSQQR
jgi:pectinesterase